MSRLVSVIAVTLFVLPAPAWGWSKTGHHVVADVAYERLDKEARVKVAAILRAHERFKDDFVIPAALKELGKEIEDRWLFLIASEWPDIIRNQKPFHHGTWHYVNELFFLGDLDKKALHGTVKPNLKRELPKDLGLEVEPDDLNAIQAFKLCLERIGHPQVGAARQARYLCWLLHIGGDLHQPLHSTALFSRGRFNQSFGDKGGNSIPTVQREQLHSFWDGLFGTASLESVSAFNNVLSMTTKLLGDAELKKAGEAAERLLAVEDYVQESHVLAKTVVYADFILNEVRNKEAGGRLTPIDLPVEYRTQAGNLARRRVVEAGYRLAKILNERLKGP